MQILKLVKETASSVQPEVRHRLGAALHALADRLDTGPPAGPGSVSIHQITRAIGDDWKESGYYDNAESEIDWQWRELIWPLIRDADFSVVLDLAVGHGRNSVRLRRHAGPSGKIYLADINQENIDFCRRRFAGDPRFEYIHCDGLSLPEIPDATVSLVYCFDAMVQFDSDTVRAYLKEFRRILRPGGRGFCHHSNTTVRPAGDFHDTPGWRNFMSREIFEHYCHKEGLRLLQARVIDWGGQSNLDCLSTFERPL